MASFLLGFGDLNYFPHTNSFLDGQKDIIKTTSLSVSDICSPFSAFLFEKFMPGFCYILVQDLQGSSLLSLEGQASVDP